MEESRLRRYLRFTAGILQRCTKLCRFSEYVVLGKKERKKKSEEALLAAGVGQRCLMDEGAHATALAPQLPALTLECTVSAARKYVHPDTHLPF